MRAGLRKNDVVTEIGRRPVTDVRSFVKAVRRVDRGKAVRLLIRREGGRNAFVAIRKP